MEALIVDINADLVVRAMDGETPLGKDYHLKLLRRAITELLITARQ